MVEIAAASRVGAEPATTATGPLSGRRILLLIVGHLANAPRARKAAAALRAAGARVLVRGVWSQARLADEDMALAAAQGIDFRPVCDLRPGDGRLADRVRHRLAHELHRRAGVHGPRLFGPGAPEMLREARALRCDLTLAHCEQGLWVASRLLAGGARVAVDFEDWFSQDQMPGDRDEALRMRLQALERALLRDARATFTTTHAMAAALAADAQATRLPVVLPNSFEWQGEPEAATGGQGVRFHWFSQTIGPGRGLEVLAQALPLLRGDWSLSLRGALLGYRPWLEETFGASLARMRLLEPVEAARLPVETARHDVGLALELPYCRNKQYTASNKLFDYLRAGLAVIATDTLGQREAMDASGDVGWCVPAGDAAALAAAMQACIDEPHALRAHRAAALASAREVWDFRHHAPRLVETVARAVQDD